ncbi:MAG: DUF2339 domain-containing protein, partial [Kiritimatiellae bacterium]|nr:DUF2339 domain-containing protein [Kiritimatiellia bacterium]
AGSALLLILYGLIRRNVVYRYAGLGLFGLATAKVVLVDASGLEGMERIATFVGTGFLLLLLSFAYQKGAAYWLRMGKMKKED